MSETIDAGVAFSMNLPRVSWAISRRTSGLAGLPIFSRAEPWTEIMVSSAVPASVLLRRT